ncbi:MAG: hypothetical protein JNL50_12885 [Phycisphaerae bacterium]|nr:hypothetical protein [Phycisphaerae bacterium]
MLKAGLGVGACAALAMMIASGTASAEIVGSALRITVTSQTMGEGTFEVSEEQGSWSGDTWTWRSGSEGIAIKNASGQTLATLSNTTMRYINDPVVSLSFSLQAGGSGIVASIASGLLSFPTILAEGKSSAGVTVTDSDGDGATMTGMAGGGEMYSAHYNGYLGAGTMFSSHGGASLVAAAWDSNVASGSLGFLPIGNVSDMSSQFAFSLTANDQASGTSVWVTQEIPAPGALALLGLAGFAARRRR